MIHKERMELIQAIARIVVSAIIICIGFVFSSGGDQTLQKVGIGFIGMVAGYWLR